MKHTLLCLDDEVDIIDALERQFRKKYRIIKCQSGPKAIQVLKSEKISLIISDQRMPEMTGVEFLSQAAQIQPDAVRILLTGYTDLDSVIQAINDGEVYRYITKPWDPRELEITVQQAIERFELKQELLETNKSLEEAVKALKQLDEAKSNFMILINHELKTPLTVLTSYLELLAETDLNSEQQLAIRRMDEARDRLNRLIEDSLLLVAVQSGQKQPKNSHCNLQDLISVVTTEFSAQIEQKNLKIEQDISKKCSIIADAHWIKTILVKLIGNSIKFGQKGSKIIISAKPSKKDLLIKTIIENEGPQISTSLIDKIKQPFTLDESSMNHREGTGLGLALSNSLLEKMGSELIVENTSQGVRVFFLLKSPDNE